MEYENFLSPLWRKVDATSTLLGTRVRIEFKPVPPPNEPAVYCVFLRDSENGTPFYIGETKKLAERLRFLFRCAPISNCHPCHSSYKNAYGSFPETDSFCADFFVRYFLTSGLCGRLEIEEILQTKYKTNKKGFYATFQKAAESFESL